MRFFILSCILSIYGFSYVSAVEPSQLQRQGGLALVAGDGAERLAVDLAKSGHWLVRVAAADEAEAVRMRATTQPWTPLVTVAVVGQQLPFTTDSINAVILAKGAAVSEAEVRRVLAPRGEVLTDMGHAVIADNPDYAAWPHFNGRADGQGVSSDKKVAPSNDLRWFAQGIPVGRLVSEAGVLGLVAEAQGAGRDDPYSGRIYGRDAFSGVLLWSANDAVQPGGVQLVVAHELGIIYAQGKDMSPVILRDKYTGEVLVTYDQGLRMVAPWGDPNQVLGPPSGDRHDNVPTNGVLLVSGDQLIQIYGPQVAALEVATGKLQWKADLKGASVKSAVSLDGRRLYVLETPAPRKNRGRWGEFKTSAVLAIDMTTGKELWRHDWSQEKTLIKGKEVVAAPYATEVFEMGDKLYLLDGVANLHSDWHGDIWALDPHTGKMQWHLEDANNKTKRKEYQKHGPMTNNYVAWNGELVSQAVVYPATVTDGASGVTALGKDDHGVALFTGAEGRKGTKRYDFLGGNQRCVRLSGTENYLVYGFNSWVDREGRSYQVSLTRGNCAMPNFPTYGAVVGVFDEVCSCYNGLRGSSALIPAQAYTVLPDGQRLTRPRAERVVANASLPDSVLLKDMIQYPSTRFFYEQETLSDTIDGLNLTVDIQRHLITASGAASWQYRGDGRSYTMPVVVGDAVYVASTAGTVTCLDKATGVPRWRFLAAPDVKEIVVNGQLENRWPVPNVLVKDGVLYCVAGRHVELNGGAWFWALDAKSGAIQQRFQAFLPMLVQEPGENIPRDGNFRSSRDWASNAPLIGGLGLNDQGQISIINRKWNKSGSRPTNLGFWKRLSDRTGDKKDRDLLDTETPFGPYIPLDFAAWNGRVIDPHQELFPHLKKK